MTQRLDLRLRQDAFKPAGRNGGNDALAREKADYQSHRLTADHDIAGANAAGLRSVLIVEHTEMGLPRGDVAAHHTITELPEILGLV